MTAMGPIGPVVEGFMDRRYGRQMRWAARAAGGLLMLGLGNGCMSLKTKSEVEVKPIHITMDINVKVDKELNNFFNDIDAQ